PLYPLHVFSSTSSTSSVLDVLAVEAKSTGSLAAGFGPSILFKDDGSSGTNYMARIASPYEANALDGNFYGALAFYTNNTLSNNPLERMRITNTGSVGIGTTAPSAALQVGFDASSSASSALFTNTSSAPTLLLGEKNLA